MHRHTLLLCWGLFCLSLYAQPRQDSLKTIWEDLQQPDSARFQALEAYIQTALLPTRSDSAAFYAQNLYAQAEQSADSHFMGKALFLQGEIADASRPTPEGLAYFEEGLSLSEAANDSSLISNFRYRLGGAYYRRNQWEKSSELLLRSAEISEPLGQIAQTARALRNVGLIYSQIGKVSEAFAYQERALQLYQSIDDQEGIADANNRLGILYFVQGDYATAIDYYQKSLDLFEQIGNPSMIATTLLHIGGVYELQQDKEQSRAYFQRGLDIADRAGDLRYVAGAAMNLGGSYMDSGEYPQAREYLTRALDLFREMNQPREIAGCLINLGKLAGEEEDWAAAVPFLQEGVDICEQLGEKEFLQTGYLSLSEALFKLGQRERGLYYGKQSLELAESQGLLFGMSSAAALMYRLHKESNQFRQALGYHEQYLEYRDSLNREENQRSAIQHEYDQQALQDSLAFVQQKTETELAYQSQLNQRNLFLTGSLILLLLALLGFLWFRYRQQQQAQAHELELARERERKEQLAELDRLKSRFFANISHELRTPLTLILGQSQRLQAEVDDPKLDARFDMMDRNSRRLLELVNQVLDLSKLESDRLSLEPQTLDLIPFLKNMLFSFESLSDQKQQQLVFQSQEESLLLVADPEKLERIFFNLLANAIKFTPERGTITLKLEREDQQVRIGLIDTGIGIPVEQQAHVFDRFYQAKGGDTHPSPGTGIGLALAKELVELHHGTIAVESQPGKGSAFWVQLPLDKTTPSSESPSYQHRLEPLEGTALPIASPMVSSETSTTNAAARILIVEDNADVRSYLRDELQQQGYLVSEAVDGKDGLTQAKAQQPDLIISDVMMPRMDGISFAQAIREDANSSHIPLILLTAKASDESRIKGLKTGVDAYLTKPFNSTELQVRVEQLLLQRKRLRQRFAEALTIQPEEVSAVPMDQQFLRQVTDTINANLNDSSFSVDLLADQIGMSVTHLNRKLKALIGQSAGKLIRSMRLQHAAELLSKGVMTISEVAYEVGFSDPTHFARSFKREFGQTPSQYVARAQAGSPE